MIRRLGVSKTGGISLLACFSLATALACGGITGCGSSNSTSPSGDDGGDAGEGGLEGGPDSPEEASPMPEGGKDSPTDSPMMMDAPVEDSPVDSPKDSPGDSPKDSPTDSPPPVDASDGCSGAVASFSTSTVPLGNGNCGGAAVTTTYSITNKGCQTLTVGATITGSDFSVSPTSLSIAPGTSGTLTLSAKVPQASTAGTLINGSLNLATNDPAHSTGTVPLTVNPTGATLAWDSTSPSSAAFGTQPVGVAATPVALKLDNKGNASASITFGTPSDAQFSVTPTSATIAAAGNASLSAGFTANTTSPSTATSTFTVTGAVCGTSVSSLAFSGQGAIGAVTGYPTSTQILQGDCAGPAPAADTFVLKNSGAVPVTITGASFSTGATGWTTNAAGAVIPGGGSFTVSISAPAVAFPNTPGPIATPTLTLTTNIAGDTPHVVDLEEDAMGAVLAFDTTPTPNFGAFGSEPVGQTASQNFNVVNTGNVDSSVTLATMTNPPFGTGTAQLTVAAGASLADTATFAPTTFGGVTGTLGMTGTALCQPPPTALNLTGTGQGGGIAISTQSLSFSANCGGTAAAPQTFTITNTGNAPMSWNAKIGSGTYYTFSPSSDGNLIAGGIDTVTITPKAIVSGADPNPATYADGITVTTNIVGDTPHTVSLGETPLGDVLSINPLTLPFGDIPTGQTSAPQSFVITNKANAGTPAASLTLTGSDATDFPMSANSATPAAAGGTSTISVQFKAPAASNMSYTSNIAVTTGDFVCGSATLPGPVVATGTSTQAGPVVKPQVLFFGSGTSNALVNCGTTGSVRTIAVTNSGQQDFNITGLPLTTGTYYTVTSSTPLPALVQASGGNTVTITVTPNQIPFPHSPVPDLTTFSDTLTIQTDANVTNKNIPVALNMGAQGVIVSNTLSTTTWDFGTVNIGSQNTFNVLLNNTGNWPAEATLTGLTNPLVFGLKPNPTIQGSAPLTSTLTGTFSPSGTGTFTDTGTLTVTPTTGGALCEALPASWQTPSILFEGQGACPHGSLVFSNAGGTTFSVPGCVSSIVVKAWGGGGGGAGDPGGGGAGGGGGYATSTLAVTGGETLNVIVGGGGGAGNGCFGNYPGGAGGLGFNGTGAGGAGGNSGPAGCDASGGGGGGGSFLLRGANALIVAGGGGGGGGFESATCQGVCGGGGGGGTSAPTTGPFNCVAMPGGAVGASGSTNGLTGHQDNNDGPGSGGGGGGLKGGGVGDVDQDTANDCDNYPAGGGGGGTSLGTSTVNGNGTVPGNSADPALPAGSAIGGGATAAGGTGAVQISW